MGLGIAYGGRDPFARRDAERALSRAGAEFVEAAKSATVPADPKGRTVWEVLRAALPDDCEAIAQGLREGPPMPEEKFRRL